MRVCYEQVKIQVSKESLGGIPIWIIILSILIGLLILAIVIFALWKVHTRFSQITVLSWSSHSQLNKILEVFCRCSWWAVGEKHLCFLWHHRVASLRRQAEQLQVGVASHQYPPAFLDGLLQEKIQGILQGVKGRWPDWQSEASHTAGGGPHTRGRTLRHSDVFRHYCCFPAGVSTQEVLRQLYKAANKERKKEPKHQLQQALSGIVHRRCAPAQIKQQSSICWHCIQ